MLMTTTKKIKSKKAQILIPSVLITALIVLGLNETPSVFAEQTASYPPIVQKIAEKFGLNEADVNEVFLQERSDIWEKRKSTLSDRLEQAVKDGKISEDQKEKILEKRDEIEADRVAQKHEFRNEMQQWMKDNGIDVNVLMPYFGFEGFAGHKIHPNYIRN